MQFDVGLLQRQRIIRVVEMLLDQRARTRHALIEFAANPVQAVDGNRLESRVHAAAARKVSLCASRCRLNTYHGCPSRTKAPSRNGANGRSEEHTSELQSLM